MISLGPEPEGLLLRKADILTWAKGLTEKQWDKIRPHLSAVSLPGCRKPLYRKTEVQAKLITPIQKEGS